MRRSSWCFLIGAVLLLAVGVAGEMEDLSRYLALVHATIVSDDDYMTGIDGLECALLQAKCYAEIGQPRRGWLTVRRCLTFAQLTVSVMLKRKWIHTMSIDHD